MTVLRLMLLISLVALGAICQKNSPQQALRPPASCPVTVPPAVRFTPPGESELGENGFWLGTEKLWTSLRKSGVWEWIPKPGHEHSVQPLTEKTVWGVDTVWGSVDYDLHREPYPDLKVTGRRLDGDAPPLLTSEATNGMSGPTLAKADMGVGAFVPTPGCWEITGDYKGQKLSFVVWVTPVKQ